MKLWILHSDRGVNNWCDDDDNPRTFLGAHSSLEHAQEFARQVAEAERAVANEDRAHDGEAPFPEIQLTWTEAYRDTADRPVLHSDTLELMAFDAFHFEVTQSSLDPELR